MCVHYWMIDSQNFGVCKLCHKKRDFKPKLDKIFESKLLSRGEAYLVRTLAPPSDYPIQGIIRFPYEYRKNDFVFSVDYIE